MSEQKQRNVNTLDIQTETLVLRSGTPLKIEPFKTCSGRPGWRVSIVTAVNPARVGALFLSICWHFEICIISGALSWKIKHPPVRHLSSSFSVRSTFISFPTTFASTFSARRGGNKTAAVKKHNTHPRSNKIGVMTAAAWSGCSRATVLVPTHLFQLVTAAIYSKHTHAASYAALQVTGSAL